MLQSRMQRSQDFCNGVLLLVILWIKGFWYDFHDDPTLIDSLLSDIVAERDRFTHGDTYESRQLLRKDIQDTSEIVKFQL